jgi:phage terminase Nu1 subunit (DNA packaging protein)
MVTKSKLMQDVERKLGENLEDYLKREHQNMSIRGMGRELNVSPSKITDWLKYFGMYQKIRREFSKMSDREFVEWVKLNYNGMSSGELYKTDPRVTQIIRSRNLREALDHEGIILAEKRALGFFKKMSNKQLIDFVAEKYKGYTIGQLESEDSSSLNNLRKRGLLEQLVEKGILVRQQRQNGFYTRMSDGQLIQYVEKNHKGKSIAEVEEIECTILEHLRERNIIEVLVAEGTLIRKVRKRNVFSKYTVKDFIEYIRKNHYQKTLTEICKEDKTAYKELKKRELDTKLIKEGIIVLKDKTEKGTYSDLSNEELFDLIENKYKGMTITELGKASSMLVILARKRKILEGLINKGIILRTKRNSGYWTKEKTYEEGKNLYLRLGYLPTQARELKDYGVGALSSAAIKYFGSFNNLKTLIEDEVGHKIEQQRLESLVNAYVEE